MQPSSTLDDAQAAAQHAETALRLEKAVLVLQAAQTIEVNEAQLMAMYYAILHRLHEYLHRDGGFNHWRNDNDYGASKSGWSPHTYIGDFTIQHKRLVRLVDTESDFLAIGKSWANLENRMQAARYKCSQIGSKEIIRLDRKYTEIQDHLRSLSQRFPV
jgi:hypothetical protein